MGTHQLCFACLFSSSFEGQEASDLLAGEAEPQAGSAGHPAAGLGGEKPSLHLPRGPLHPRGAAGAASALESSASPEDSPHPKELAAQGTCNSSPSFFCMDTGQRQQEQRQQKPGLLPTSFPCRVLQDGDSEQVPRCWHFQKHIYLRILRKDQ